MSKFITFSFYNVDTLKKEKNAMKKTIKFLMSIFCVTIMCVSMVFLTACGDTNKSIVISGSSSVTPIMEKLAAEYEKTHDVRIIINMSSSGAGISDAQNGLNDFGMSSRELKDSETGVTGEVLCMDGIALIVNKNCTVNNVSKSDVKNLFENGIAIPETTITAGIGRDGSSGTRTAFDELLGIKNYHSKVSTLAETGNVIEAIKASKNSLGYISYGSVNESIKALSLDGIACNMENIKNSTYALQRPFVIVINKDKKLSAEAQEFYNFIMSSQAQEIITKAGYISVK